MKQKLIWNDYRHNKLQTISILLFMMLSCLLFSITINLFANLTGSISNLMYLAGTPDFLQMHSGEIDLESVERFSEENKNIQDWQICKFLNLDNGTIYLDGKSLANSGQDNGVSVQGEDFDYLLNQKNEIVYPESGEIFVPICYKQEFALHVGETVEIGENEFQIGGFVRDSQMNSTMASSKRFLVSKDDYEKIQPFGEEEYLIEYILVEKENSGSFATDYANSKMPTNGPAITKDLILMMNALSDGLMIFVLLVVSVLIFGVCVLCIQFTILTKLEKEKKEIGMLKAIGIRQKNIRRMYFQKYMLLSVVAATAGVVLALILQPLLMKRMQELYGPSPKEMLSILWTIIGSIFIGTLMILLIWNILRTTEKMTALLALRDEYNRIRKKRLGEYGLLIIVLTMCFIMMLLPQNVRSSMESSKFVTYMGVGNGEIRFDIRQSEDIIEQTEKLEKLLVEDEVIENYSVLVTSTWKAVTDQGDAINLKVEAGNHGIFPVAYSKGAIPDETGELALSYLMAQELNKEVGDWLVIQEDQELVAYKVSGIYSDITNGGKTAKVYDITPLSNKESVMWSIIYVSLDKEASKSEWTKMYQHFFDSTGMNIKMENISEYVANTYGQTIGQVQMASKLSILVAGIIAFLIALLFVKLQIEREKYTISLKKALGFTDKDVAYHYYGIYLLSVLVAILMGIFLGKLLGEFIMGIFLESMGATGFQFILDYKMVLLILPLLMISIVVLGIRIGLKKTEKIKASLCCMGRE